MLVQKETSKVFPWFCKILENKSLKKCFFFLTAKINLHRKIYFRCNRENGLLSKGMLIEGTLNRLSPKIPECLWQCLLHLCMNLPEINNFCLLVSSTLLYWRVVSRKLPVTRTSDKSNYIQYKLNSFIWLLWNNTH